MTFQEFKEELEKLGLDVLYNKETNCVHIKYSKYSRFTFATFPFDGYIEDIEAPEGLGVLGDDIALMLREYISLYLSTPIHKRSKHPKYYLKLNNNFDDTFGYLGYVTDSKKYVFDNICQDDEDFQSQFTDIEIDKMPAGIRSMIRIGVLNKVVV